MGVIDTVAPEFKRLLDQAPTSRVSRGHRLVKQGFNIQATFLSVDHPLRMTFMTGRFQEEVPLDWIPANIPFLFKDCLEKNIFPVSLVAARTTVVKEISVQSIREFLQKHPQYINFLKMYYSVRPIAMFLDQMASAGSLSQSQVLDLFQGNHWQKLDWQKGIHKIDTGQIYFVQSGTIKLKSEQNFSYLSKNSSLIVNSEIEKISGGTVESVTNAEVYCVSANKLEKCINPTSAWKNLEIKNRNKIYALYDWQEVESVISVKGLSDRKINYLKKMLPDVQFDQMKLSKTESSMNLISVLNFLIALGLEKEMSFVKQNLLRPDQIDLYQIAQLAESIGAHTEFRAIAPKDQFDFPFLFKQNDVLLLALSGTENQLIILHPAHGLQVLNKDSLFGAEQGLRVLLGLKDFHSEYLTPAQGPPALQQSKIKEFVKKNIWHEKWLVINLIAFAFFLAGLVNIKTVFMQKIFDEISLSRDTKLTLALLVGLLVISFFNYLTKFANSVINSKLSLRLANRLKILSLRHNIFLPRQQLMSAQPGSLLLRIDTFDSFANMIYTIPFSIARASISLIMSLWLLLSYSPLYAAIVIGYLFFTLFFFMRFFYEKLDEVGFNFNARATYNTSLLQFSSGFSSLMSFDHLNKKKKELFASYLGQSENGEAFSRKQSGVRLIADISVSIIQILIIYFIITTGMNKQIPTGVAVAIIVLLGTLVSEIRALFQSIFSLKTLSGMMNSLSSLMQPNEIHNQMQTQANPHRLKGAVRLEQIYFRYSDQAPPVLQNVSFKFNAGEIISLVGKSGAGKSTIGQIIAGFLQPQSGKINYDEIDSKNIALTSIRKYVQYVDSIPWLFSGTVLDNICVQTVNIDQTRLDNALRIAQLTSVIDQRPQFLHQKLGESGQGLSAGEKQQVAIARAIYQAPQILIIDEATCHLDPLTEHHLFTELIESKESMTIILISQNLTFSRFANKIYVISSGQIVEQGTYNELLRGQREYSEIFRSQLEHD